MRKRLKKKLLKKLPGKLYNNILLLTKDISGISPYCLGFDKGISGGDYHINNELGK